MLDIYEWSRKHPHAASDLNRILGAVPWGDREADGSGSESSAQQAIRLEAGRRRWFAWRNNVGATPSKTRHVCPKCHFLFEETQTPVRYGLANDSSRLNACIKSSDLILAIPRVITPSDVGTTIAQFGSIEVKRPGWSFNPKDKREAGQWKWLSLIKRIGGRAGFSTGELDI